MAEDLSTYTEVDPNSHISATSSRMTGSFGNITVNRGGDIYASRAVSNLLRVGSCCEEANAPLGQLGSPRLGPQRQGFFGAVAGNKVQVCQVLYGIAGWWSKITVT